jgi:hypothetical protein
VATVPFSININGEKKDYSNGTIWIPLSMQSKNENEIFELVKKIAEKNALQMDAVQTGEVLSGSDLGSSKFYTIESAIHCNDHRKWCECIRCR